MPISLATRWLIAFRRDLSSLWVVWWDEGVQGGRALATWRARCMITCMLWPSGYPGLLDLLSARSGPQSVRLLYAAHRASVQLAARTISSRSSPRPSFTVALEVFRGAFLGAFLALFLGVFLAVFPAAPNRCCPRTSVPRVTSDPINHLGPRKCPTKSAAFPQDIKSRAVIHRSGFPCHCGQPAGLISLRALP